jgi:hypothetical protein
MSIVLKPEITRCRPASICPRQEHCARYRAAVTHAWASVADFRAQLREGAECDAFVALADAAPRIEPQEPKPWPGE